MTTATVQKRLIKLEAEMNMLKKTLPPPDLSIDDKNWLKVRSTVKKIREKLYKERYA